MLNCYSHLQSIVKDPPPPVMLLNLRKVIEKQMANYVQHHRFLTIRSFDPLGGADSKELEKLDYCSMSRSMWYKMV